MTIKKFIPQLAIDKEYFQTKGVVGAAVNALLRT
jgi:hypothetical protein